MADLQRRPVATRIAQLELKDEQRLVKEGYELLDEKRIRLVAEIRAQLGRLRRWQAEVRKAQEAAQAALQAALNRHGIDELSFYPALSLMRGSSSSHARGFSGSSSSRRSGTPARRASRNNRSIPRPKHAIVPETIARCSSLW